MIHWNPARTRVTNGVVYGVNTDGCFEFESTTAVIPSNKIGSVDPLDTIQLIHLFTEPYHVLVQLSQREFSSFDADNQLGALTIQTLVKSKDFFRIGVQPETGKTTFVDIPSLSEEPIFQTDEAKKIIELLPEYQLAQFGIASLKQVIK